MLFVLIALLGHGIGEVDPAFVPTACPARIEVHFNLTALRHVALVGLGFIRYTALRSVFRSSLLTA